MQIKCSRCGGDVQVVTDDQFVDCDYCHTSLFVHFEGNSEHYLLKPVIGPKTVPLVIEKWLHQGDYSGKSEIISAKMVYFPFWLFQTTDSNTLLPAASDPTREIQDMTFSGADMRVFNAADCSGARVISASIYISVARERFLEMGRSHGPVKAEHLLHYPLYAVRYGYGGSEYRAIVDAVSGQVHSHDRPPPESATRSRRFLTMAAAAFAAFFIVDMALDSFPLELLMDSIVGVGLYFLGRSYLERGVSTGGGE